MWAWIGSNIWTIVICIVLLGLTALAARYLLKTRKKGGCAGCTGCGGGACHCPGYDASAARTGKRG